MTTMTQQPVRRTIAVNKVAAILAWLGGVFTTWLFLTVSAPSLPWYIALIAAAVIQWILTIAERPLWRVFLRRKGGRFVIMGVVVTLADGLINAAGIYPHVGRLAQTGVGVMLADVLNVDQSMGPGASFLLAFAIGLVVAGLPEYLWEADER